MLNCLASLVMSTSVLEALPDNLDIKRHIPCILYTLVAQQVQSDEGFYYWLFLKHFRTKISRRDQLETLQVHVDTGLDKLNIYV